LNRNNTEGGKLVETLGDNSFKTCIYCGEEIGASSKRCDYCGSLLYRACEAAEPTYTKPAYNEPVYTEPIYTDGRLGNGIKVLLTIISVIIPGFGQLAGIITAVTLINHECDRDRKSFGVALLAASLFFFVLYCAAGFMLLLNAATYMI